MGNRGLEVDPNGAALLLHTAVALASQGKAGEAEERLSRAVALDPRYAEAWAFLGDLFRRRDALPQAKQAYERALALNPGINPAVTEALRSVETSLAAGG